MQELVQSTNITFTLTTHCHQSQSPKFCKLSVTSKPTLAEQPLISCCSHFNNHWIYNIVISEFSPVCTLHTAIIHVISVIEQQRLVHNYTIGVKFTYEQYATINQTNAGRFDPRVFVNCLQVTIGIHVYTWDSTIPILLYIILVITLCNVQLWSGLKTLKWPYTWAVPSPVCMCMHAISLKQRLLHLQDCTSCSYISIHTLPLQSIQRCAIVTLSSSPKDWKCESIQQWWLSEKVRFQPPFRCTAVCRHCDICAAQEDRWQWRQRWCTSIPWWLVDGTEAACVLYVWQIPLYWKCCAIHSSIQCRSVWVV